MPGPAHERVSTELYGKIVDKIVSIPGHSRASIQGFGATQFHPPRVRSKQADKALGPATRVGWDAWPSLVIEVGYSERLKPLRMDAEWWLINSAGKTKFVIIIKITRHPFTVHIECWKMIPPSRRQTRHTPAQTPHQIQEFDIDSVGVVASASSELSIPYLCIFDEDHDDATNVVFTKAELSSFALRVFSLLQ